MDMANEYDVVVIGPAPAATWPPSAPRSWALKTAVVERAPALGGHVPQLGLHPDQGAARARARAEDRAGLEGVGPHDRGDRRRAIGIDMTQVHARKDKIVKGLTGGIEFLFKKNKIDWIKGSGAAAGKGASRSPRATPADADGAQGDHRRDRIAPRSVPGHRDRSQAHHHERRGDHLKEVPEVDRHHGQRRGRRRVRVDLPALRQRGDDHRAAAARSCRSKTRRSPPSSNGRSRSRASRC